MAARQQQKGTVSGIQYEVLVPKSEWKDQPEATLLTINLAGFAKEQIKVTYVHTSKMLRVTGERPVAGWRWIRFNELFSVPQNCLVDMIHGSFKNDVLTITMPKEKITTMANLPEASKTVAAQEKVEKLEEKMLLEEAKWKEKVEEAEQKKKQLLDEREELIRKLHEEAKAKEKYELMMRKLQEEVKAKEKPGNRNLVEGPTLEKIQERKSGGKERKLPEVVCTKSGPGSESGSGSAGGVGEVVKSAAERLGYLVEKEKKMGKGIIERIRRKEITSEEKKVMVNVGMAALVILALGAYVSYTFSSSSPTSSSSSPSSSSSSPSSSSSSPSSSSSSPSSSSSTKQE